MNEFIDEVLKRKYGKKIYIYGVGAYSQQAYRLLLKNNIDVDAFIVTSDDTCNRNLFPLPIYKAKETDFTNVLLIIGTGRHVSMEIKEYLETQSNCNMDDVIMYWKYLLHTNADYCRKPTLEITTAIGCKINCTYCPQKLLLRKYFENNPDRDQVMSMDVFRKCLKNLPDECVLSFCGMAEPFLNRDCNNMILEAIEAGKNVELYTTLVGAQREDIEKIWDIPFDYVNIHIPDEEGNAKIPITEEYLKLLTDVISHKREDGTSFVNLCSSQGAPNEKVLQICQDKFDTLTVLHDRAGNLDGPLLMHKEHKTGKLSCTTAGPGLEKGVLLPDGTVLLCCMDYGMKHILGNLAEQTYEEIIHGKEHDRIMQGINGDESIDILCRKCSMASSV